MEALGYLGERTQQIVHADEAGTRTGEQDTAGSKDLHSEHIQPTIGFQGLHANALRFGEGGRIQYHHIELLSTPGRLLQVIKYIGYKKIVRVGVEAIEGEVLMSHFNGWFGYIYTGDMCITTGQRGVD